MKIEVDEEQNGREAPGGNFCPDAEDRHSQPLCRKNCTKQMNGESVLEVWISTVPMTTGISKVAEHVLREES